MEEESMMMPVRPPRGMTARQVTMLRRLYTMHIEQQEAIFAQPPSPAPAPEAVVTATRAEARKARDKLAAEVLVLARQVFAMLDVDDGGTLSRDEIVRGVEEDEEVV